MSCRHCNLSPTPRVYCCEKAELEALRDVADEVRLLLIAMHSLGAVDEAPSVTWAAARLRAVRDRAQQVA